jgi:hypothetical protein
MAIGDLDEAARLLEQRNSSKDLGVGDAFNLGMARFWQGDHATGRDLMKVVVDNLAETQGDDSVSLSQMQCLAFANWAIGEIVAANKLLTRVKGRAAHQPRPIFSCWRYMNSLPRDFRRDLDEMERLFDGADVVPRFVRVRQNIHA